MEHLILDLDYNLTTYEILSYFSCELFYFIGFILNLILFMFFRAKTVTKRISDILTTSILLIGSGICASTLFQGADYYKNFSFDIIGSLFTSDINTMSSKLVVNIFLLFYSLIIYKIIRKTRIKVPYLNSILLLIALFGSLLTQSSSCIFTFLLLEIVVILIYKYASNMKVEKFQTFSKDFIITNAIASILFFTFLISNYLIKDTNVHGILYTGMTISYLLKIGIFPLFNYTINKHYKTNLPYAILLFNFLPLLGIMSFDKITQKISIHNEIYQFSMIIFLSLTILSMALFIAKQKNLIKFLAGISYSYGTFCIMNLLFMGPYNSTIKLYSYVSLAILGLFSLLCVIQINTNASKINRNKLKNIFANNKILARLLLFLFLLICGILPSGIIKENIAIINNIYLFDKITLCFLFTILITYSVLIINSIKTLQVCYSLDKTAPIAKYTKRTTINYVVPFVIILLLIIGILL